MKKKKLYVTLYAQLHHKVKTKLRKPRKVMIETVKMKETYLLIACGTLVRTRIGRLEGMVTGISIRFDRVIYEISYFALSEQKIIWMNEKEFDVIGKETKTVGFANKVNGQ